MEQLLDFTKSVTSHAKDFISGVRRGDSVLLAAAAGIVASAYFLRRALQPRKQRNGGIGGQFAFVDPVGKCVAVTGCDSGFGYLAATELARLGSTVFAGCYDVKASKPKLEAEVAQLTKDRNGRNITGVSFSGASSKHAPLGKIICLPLDVTKDDSVNAFYDAVVGHEAFKSGEGLFCLLNNAGINAGYLMEFSTIKHLDQNMQVNYYGAARVALKFLPLLRAKALEFKQGKCEQPRLVSVTSGAGIMVASPLGPYSASKHAMEAWTDGLRQELAHHGIPLHCTLIQPTIAMTPIVTTDISAQFDKYIADAGVSKEVMDAYGGYEYQKAQWSLSAVHLPTKPGPMLLQPEAVVKSIVEEVAREKGMKIWRPVPDLGMGIALFLYQNLPTKWVDSGLATGQRMAVLEKLGEMQAEKQVGVAVAVKDKPKVAMKN